MTAQHASLQGNFLHQQAQASGNAGSILSLRIELEHLNATHEAELSRLAVRHAADQAVLAQERDDMVRETNDQHKKREEAYFRHLDVIDDRHNALRRQYTQGVPMSTIEENIKTEHALAVNEARLTVLTDLVKRQADVNSQGFEPLVQRQAEEIEELKSTLKLKDGQIARLKLDDDALDKAEDETAGLRIKALAAEVGLARLDNALQQRAADRYHYTLGLGKRVELLKATSMKLLEDFKSTRADLDAANSAIASGSRTITGLLVVLQRRETLAAGGLDALSSSLQALRDNAIATEVEHHDQVMALETNVDQLGEELEAVHAKLQVLNAGLSVVTEYALSIPIVTKAK